MFVSISAGFWGQYLVRKLVAIVKRASIIVFILSGVIFTSAIVMGKSSKLICNFFSLYLFCAIIMHCFNIKLCRGSWYNEEHNHDS